MTVLRALRGCLPRFQHGPHGHALRIALEARRARHHDRDLLDPAAAEGAGAHVLRGHPIAQYGPVWLWPQAGSGTEGATAAVPCTAWQRWHRTVTWPARYCTSQARPCRHVGVSATRAVTAISSTGPRQRRQRSRRTAPQGRSGRTAA